MSSYVSSRLWHLVFRSIVSFRPCDSKSAQLKGSLRNAACGAVWASSLLSWSDSLTTEIVAVVN